jgi:hypothetical protein
MSPNPSSDGRTLRQFRVTSTNTFPEERLSSKLNVRQPGSELNRECAREPLSPGGYRGGYFHRSS